VIVYIARDGAEFGEYPRANLEQLAREGELQPTDLCWFEGMTNWLLLEDFLGKGVWPTKKPAVVSMKELRPARVKPLRPRSFSSSQTRPKLPAAETRAFSAKPESPWIFISAIICVVLIWLAASTIKFFGLPKPEPAPVSLLKVTPSPEKEPAN
jgi:hypothetical protein